MFSITAKLSPLAPIGAQIRGMATLKDSMLRFNFQKKFHSTIFNLIFPLVSIYSSNAIEVGQEHPEDHTVDEDGVGG